MTREEWQELYDISKKIHQDFILNYHKSTDGKNSTIRKDAKREVDNALTLAKYHLKNNWEALILIAGETSAFNVGIVRDELFLPHYFGADMRTILEGMKSKIKSFDE